MTRSPRPVLGVVLVAVAALAAACGSHPKAAGWCSGDKDCKAPLVCANNRCVECTSDAQCTDGKKCSENACVASNTCTSDAQCPAGQSCEDGACKPCGAEGCPQHGKKCSQDTDCADDEDCKGGYCTKAVQATTADVSCSLQTIYFAFDQSAIQPAERDHLDQNQQCIEKAKAKGVFVIGHTDSSGTEEYNIALSERRAQAVADYLSRLGTDPARLQVIPKGETEPTGLGDDKDRRVELQWH